MNTLTSLCRTLSSNPGFIYRYLDLYNLPRDIDLFKGLHSSCSSFQVDPKLRTPNDLLLGKRTMGKSKFIRNLNIPYPNVPDVLKCGHNDVTITDTNIGWFNSLSLSNTLNKSFIAYNLTKLKNNKSLR